MINIIDSIQGVDSLKDDWERLQWHPQGQFGYFSTILKYRKDIIKPYIFHIQNDHGHQIIVASLLFNTYKNFTVGKIKFFKNRVKVFGINQSWIMGSLSKEGSVGLIKQIKISLREEKADYVTFHYLNSESPIVNAIRETTSPIARDYFTYDSEHWIMEIPKSKDIFYKSIKNVKKLYSQKRKFEKDFETTINIKVFSSFQEIPGALEAVESIASKTYQRLLKVGFDNSPEIRNAILNWSSQGNVFIYILFHGNKPSAFQITALQKNYANLLWTGFDPEYINYSIGSILQVYVIEDLISRHIEFLDFGPGCEEYKRRFGTLVNRVATVRIFSSSLRGICLNLLFSFTSFATETIRKLLTYLGYYKVLKKRVRKQI